MARDVLGGEGGEGTPGAKWYSGINSPNSRNLLTANQASLSATTTGWNAGADTAISASTEQFLDETHSLKLMPTGTVGEAITDFVPIEISVQYSAMAGFWTESIGSVPTVTITEYDNDDNIVGVISYGQEVEPGWTFMPVTIEPNFGTKAKVTVSVTALAEGDVSYVDKIQLREGIPDDWTPGGDPPAAAPDNNVGDYYLNILNGDIFKKGAMSWTFVVNMKGADGAQGIEGPAGSQGPAGNDGAEGPAGVRGTKWFSGGAISPPIAGSAVGDWYLNTETGEVWERLGMMDTPLGWTNRGFIMGPIGPAGGIQSRNIATETFTEVPAATQVLSICSQLPNPGVKVFRIETDFPTRVRLYDTSAHQTADAARAIGVDPVDNHGVLLDVVTTLSILDFTLSPALDIHVEPATDPFPITVDNLDALEQDVAVMFHYVRTEEV